MRIILPGQGIVRAAKPLFATAVEPAETSRANNGAERRNPGKPGFCSRQDAKMAPATKN